MSVWLTTPDESHRLSAQSDLYFVESTTYTNCILIDEFQCYQEV